MPQFDFLREVSGSFDATQNSENVPKGAGFDKVDFGESTKTHKYPLYIDNLNGRNNVPIVQECIHFTAVKQGGISLQKEADESAAIAKAESEQFRANNVDKNGLTEFDKIGNGSSNSIQQQTKAALADKAAEIGEKITDDSKLSDAALAGFKKLGGIVKKGLKQVREKPKNLEHCFLYMPNSVQFSEGASWGAEKLGGIGNLIKEGIRGEGDAGDLIKNFSGGAITGLGKAVAVGAGAAALGAIGAIGIASTFEGVGSGLRAAGRFTENPYEEQLFNGIEFRTFSFEFVFAPSNEDEGREVNNIIKMFRFHSRPNFVGGSLGEGLYTFPNEFSINFLKNNHGSFIKNKSIPSIYNCVCTNVSTNYTPEGFWVALTDGTPVSYGLTLAFTETKKITQKEITAGF